MNVDWVFISYIISCMNIDNLFDVLCNNILGNLYLNRIYKFLGRIIVFLILWLFFLRFFKVLVYGLFLERFCKGVDLIFLFFLWDVIVRLVLRGVFLFLVEFLEIGFVGVFVVGFLCLLF